MTISAYPPEVTVTPTGRLIIDVPALLATLEAKRQIQALRELTAAACANTVAAIETGGQVER